MVRPGSPCSLVPGRRRNDLATSPAISAYAALDNVVCGINPPSAPQAVTNEELEYLHARHMAVQAALAARGIGYVDAFHGEMGFGVHDEVRAQLAKAELDGYDVTDATTGALKSKTTPRRLQNLVAETVMARWARQIPAFSPGHILMTPYSSLITLETALRSLQHFNPGKTTLLVPDGHYKSLVRHIKACNLTIVPIPTDLAQNCRLEPHMLRAAVAHNRENLAGLLLTIPGNPLLSTYTDPELDALGRVLVEEDVYCVIDAAFELVVEPYKPLAAVTLESGASLYDRVAMVTGVSKSHHATGPEKFGAVVTGNPEWRKAMGMELAHQFQRGTAARNELVLLHTPQKWLDENCALMKSGQQAATDCFKRIAAKYRQTVFVEVGNNTEGPFKVISVAANLLKNVGVHDSPQLQEYLLISGMDCVPGIRVGLDATRGHVPAVRVNVHAPRIGNDISSKHRAVFHAALDRCAENLIRGTPYSELCDLVDMQPMAVPQRRSIKTTVARKVPLAPTLGVIHEGKSDRRVALTPATVRSIVSDHESGACVLIESGAGLTAGFSDADFISAGATIAPRETVLAVSNTIVAFKPFKNMTEKELISLRADQRVVGFFGVYGSDRISRGDIQFSGISLDDGVSLSPGVHSPLSAMSVYAGELALDHGASLLKTEFEEWSKKNCSTKVSVVIIGSGHAARAAAKRALVRKMKVTVISVSPVSETELASQIEQVRIPRKDTPAARAIVLDCLRATTPNVVVSAASRSFAPPPVLITKEHLDFLNEFGHGTVIIDLTVAAGGNVEGGKLDSSIRVRQHVVIGHRSNYPSDVPRESSSAYAAAVLRLLRGKDIL